jgi:transposase
MGTLLLTLNKWEIVSGDLGGHYNQHLRTLLVHGGRSVVRTAQRKSDPASEWVNELRERRGYNRAAVAVANKNARVIWALLQHGGKYRANP